MQTHKPMEGISFSIHKCDKNWILNANGRFFSINNNTVRLLKILQDADSYQSAHQAFIQQTSKKISLSDFVEIANQQIKKLGLDGESRGSSKLSYVKLKKILINENSLAKIPPILCTLFTPFVFYYTLFAALLFCAYLTSTTFDKIDFSIVRFGWPIGLLILSLLLHELAHVCACRHFNIASKGIGFGFYYLFPVAYSDVTNIWLLPKHKRQIVNLAGFYIECLFSALIGGVGLLLSNDILLSTACVLFILSFRSLNPFLRSDGYWILSDHLDKPDLMNESWRNLQQLIMELFQRNFKVKRTQLAMSTYAVINISVVFFLLFYIYDTQTSAIIDLPSTTFLYVREIASGNFNENVFTIENGIALVFYLMLFRLSFKMAFALTRIYKDAGGSCNVK